MARCESCIGSIKRDRYFEQNISHLVLEKMSERERERQGKKTRFSSAIHGVSLSPELKFFVSTRATRRHQKGEISSKIKRGDFGEIKVFGFRRCSHDLLPFYYISRGKDSSYFCFIPNFGLILGLIVEWFYVMFMACFVRVCGMFYGLNWEDIVASGKWLFSGWFQVKTVCTRATKELSVMLLHG